MAEAVEKVPSNRPERNKRIDGTISANLCYQMRAHLESLLRRRTLKIVFQHPRLRREVLLVLSDVCFRFNKRKSRAFSWESD